MKGIKGVIEKVTTRVIKILKAYLPSELSLIRKYWEDSDILKFGRQITLDAPRDDAGGSAYFIGEPSKIADFPAVCISFQNMSFEQNSVGSSREGFQAERYNLVVNVYYRVATSENNEFLERGVSRLTDAVINTLRRHPYLENPVTSKEPIVKSFGFSGSVVYHPKVVPGHYAFKWAEFGIVYRATGKMRQEVYFMD